MAKQRDSDMSEQRDRQTEIEITEEMIEAGRAVIIAWERSDSPYLGPVVEEVYRQMKLASRQQPRQHDGS